MGARQKLNEVYAVGCVILAGVLGYATGSGLVFLVALVVLLALCMISGGLRLD